jgi:uronate dehydrogenase
MGKQEDDEGAMMKRKILLTGASGLIGSFCTQRWVADDCYDLVLTNIRAPKKGYDLPFHLINLADFGAVRPLCEGIDTVVHLGADPSMQATWESLLPNNLIATYNVFESAHQANCRRVVFASSVNAVIGYPEDVQVHIDTASRDCLGFEPCDDGFEIAARNAVNTTVANPM